MKLTQDVLEVLSTCDVHAYSVQITSGQLDRKLYLKVNEALEALGGKWNRKAKAHLFELEPAELLDNAILTGEVEVPKDLDFFETPKGLACEMVSMLGDIRSKYVLEPSAGKGAIARELLAAGAHVGCVELSDKRFATLLDEGFTAVQGDFLKFTNPHRWPIDAVCMNPPFSKRQDILHVQHALKLLKRGGKLVSVMSAGVTFRRDKLTTEFREAIEDAGGEFKQLPPGAFKSSGTNVNAVVLEVVK